MRIYERENKTNTTDTIEHVFTGKNWQSVCLTAWLPSKAHWAAIPRELKKSTFSLFLYYSSPGPTSVQQRWMQMLQTSSHSQQAVHCNALTGNMKAKSKRTTLTPAENKARRPVHCRWLFFL